VSMGLAAVLRRTAPPRSTGAGLRRPLPEDALEWSWPPYAPVPQAGQQQFDTAEWAPSSDVWHPQVRLGRWTVVYRRNA
jgi:hypothetical protein